MRWSRITSMAAMIPPSLLHGVGQEAQEARALDGLRQDALLLGRHRGDAARHHLAALRHEALQQAHILVIDLRRVRPGEWAGLAPAEEGTTSPAATAALAAFAGTALAAAEAAFAGRAAETAFAAVAAAMAALAGTALRVVGHASPPLLAGASAGAGAASSVGVGRASSRKRGRSSRGPRGPRSSSRNERRPPPSSSRPKRRPP